MPHLHYRSKMGRGLSALRGGSGKAGRQTLLQKRNFYSGRSRGISQVLKAKSPIFLQWMRDTGLREGSFQTWGTPTPGSVWDLNSRVSPRPVLRAVVTMASEPWAIRKELGRR